MMVNSLGLPGALREPSRTSAVLYNVPSTVQLVHPLVRVCAILHLQTDEQEHDDKGLQRISLQAP